MTSTQPRLRRTPTIPSLIALAVSTLSSVAFADESPNITYLLEVRDVSDSPAGDLGPCTSALTNALGARGFVALAHPPDRAGDLDTAAREFGVPLVLHGAFKVWDTGPVMRTGMRSFRASGTLHVVDVPRGTILVSESQQHAHGAVDSTAGLLATSAKLCGRLGASIACGLSARLGRSTQGCVPAPAKAADSAALPPPPPPRQAPVDQRAECEKGSLPACARWVCGVDVQEATCRGDEFMQRWQQLTTALREALVRAPTDEERARSARIWALIHGELCAQYPRAAECAPAQARAASSRGPLGDWRQVIFRGATQTTASDTPLPPRYTRDGALELSTREQVVLLGSRIEGTLLIETAATKAIPVQLTLRDESGELERLGTEYLARLAPADDGCGRGTHTRCDPVAAPPRRVPAAFAFRTTVSRAGTYEVRAEAERYGAASAFLRIVPGPLVRAHAAHDWRFAASAVRGRHAPKGLSTLEVTLAPDVAPLVLNLAEYASDQGSLDLAVSEPLSAAQQRAWSHVSGALEKRPFGGAGRTVRALEGTDGVMIVWLSAAGKLLVVAERGGHAVAWAAVNDLWRKNPSEER